MCIGNTTKSVSPSYVAAVRVEEASHDDDNQVLKERQASHDDVGNPLICWLHTQQARNLAYFIVLAFLTQTL